MSSDCDIGYFDLVLLPGVKDRDRLLKKDLLKHAHRIVGYSKFDIALKKSPRLFTNKRPTVLYNPHFDPKLSSWRKLGLEVLEYFRNWNDYNLIFAPHIRLQDKENLADSPVLDSYRDMADIRLDLGSISSSDMSYTLASDIYLGDVSSQFYEFLVKPRPCVFLNAHNVDWKDNPNYLHWRFGPVLTNLSRLGAHLGRAQSTQRRYEARQREIFAQSIQTGETPASQFSADTIVDYLSGKDVSWPPA